jgi:hypothetical protein
VRIWAFVFCQSNRKQIELRFTTIKSLVCLLRSQNNDMKSITLTLPENYVERIDKERGDIPRTRFLRRRLMENKTENEIS